MGAASGMALHNQAGQAAVAAKGGKMSFFLRSQGFVEGGGIPARYTCDGLNLSPQLSWGGAPAGTKSYVLIVDDPDAPGGTFVHWVLLDIGARTEALPEGQPATKLGIAGINDFGKSAYGGPCPPKGRGTHRYFFTLSALDIPGLGLGPGATLVQVNQKVTGHVLGTAKLMGRYTRQ
ncbi:MAG: YbhB/YbcL family Raf kinase inhibitor-like protein [Acidobacteria bacterium]|nr:YbhB/YbcL family Raf kinase inhibitor-like protein [Acidobacteriota bacterium]